jgi:hypothetical protein
MTNTITVGPILGFRGAQNGRWQTSALVVTSEKDFTPEISFKNSAALASSAKPAKLLKTVGESRVWRLEWEIEQGNQQQSVEYSADGTNYFVYTVPELGKPLRIAYGSCFGFSKLSEMKKVKNKNQMWDKLLGEHRQKPYHLMIHGGDQVYADLMFETVAPLKEWQELKIKDRIKAPFTAELERLVPEFYFKLYSDRWSAPGPADALHQIPSLMMWDDHVIFDGWGSYPADQQKSEVFQGIYRHARDFFRLFQMQAANDADLPPGVLDAKTGFTYAYRIGDLGIVGLDMRSERSKDQVMSLKAWDQVRDWMATLDAKKLPDWAVETPACRHLIVVSSIPVVYVNANIVESALGVLPGQNELEDDFKDQWMSHSHHEERLRLIHRLFTFSKQTGCRVTIVSGDVHVGALGYLQSKLDFPLKDLENGINQLISSGMVHPPPAGIIVYMLEKVLGKCTDEIEQGIQAQMVNFPGSSRRFLGARNWLSLTCDDKSRIWAEWFAENEPKPYTKVILPLDTQ